MQQSAMIHIDINTIILKNMIDCELGVCSISGLHCQEEDGYVQDPTSSTHDVGQIRTGEAYKSNKSKALFKVCSMMLRNCVE